MRSLLVALAVVSFVGCAVPIQTPPKTGVAVTWRLSFPFSYTQVWKDGRLHGESVFTVNAADDLREVVKDHQPAYDKANTAHSLALAAIPIGIGGLGVMVGGAVYAAGGTRTTTDGTGRMQTEVTDKARDDLGKGIAIGGIALVIASGIMNLVAGSYIQDATVLYNNRAGARRPRFLAVPTVIQGERDTAPGLAIGVSF